MPCGWLIAGHAIIGAAVREATLAELLSGSWVGTWTRGGGTVPGVKLHYGMLTLPMTLAWTTRLRIEDEGYGRFRGTVGELAIVGIWKYETGVLTLCNREVAKGYPERFNDEERQDLIELRMRWNAVWPTHPPGTSWSHASTHQRIGQFRELVQRLLCGYDGVRCLV